MPRARRISNELEEQFIRIMEKHPHGLLTEEGMVEEAADPSNPLHKHFTWDDTKAAHKWRLEEARLLIRSYRIYNEDLELDVRALTSLDIDREHGGGYRFVTDVVEREDLRESMVRTALQELMSTRRKYDHIRELAGLWGYIDKEADKHMAGTSSRRSEA